MTSVPIDSPEVASGVLANVLRRFRSADQILARVDRCLGTRPRSWIATPRSFTDTALAQAAVGLRLLFRTLVDLCHGVLLPGKARVINTALWRGFSDLAHNRF